MLDSSSQHTDRSRNSAYGLLACTCEAQAEDPACDALRPGGECLLRLPRAPQASTPALKPVAAPAAVPCPLQAGTAAAGAPYTPAWRASNAMLGRAVVNESGQPLGQVDELIVGPGRALSYLIIGVGSFLGGARHEVAVPLAQMQNQDGRLLLPGATRAGLLAMPAFNDDDDLARRDAFMAEAGLAMGQAQDDIETLRLQAATASGSIKQALDCQATALQQDLTAAQARRAELRAAPAMHWKAFAASLSIATHRLRLAVDLALR